MLLWLCFGCLCYEMLVLPSRTGLPYSQTARLHDVGLVSHLVEALLIWLTEIHRRIQGFLTGGGDRQLFNICEMA